MTRARLVLGITTVTLAAGLTAGSVAATAQQPADRAATTKDMPSPGVRDLGAYQAVTSPGKLIGTNAATFVTAACPPNTVVLGGGGSNTSTYGAVLLTDSFPTSGNTWTTWFRNDSSSSTFTIYAYVMCGR